MTKNKRDRDDYGFSEDYQYDRTIDYPNKEKKNNKPNIKKILFIIAISLLVIFYVCLLSISGYIAWNSVTSDPLYLKLLKTYLAVLFAPAYLFYIFIRSFIFKLPN